MGHLRIFATPFAATVLIDSAVQSEQPCPRKTRRTTRCEFGERCLSCWHSAVSLWAFGDFPNLRVLLPWRRTAQHAKC